MDDAADKSRADLVERLKFFREIGAEMIFTSELRPRPKPQGSPATPAAGPRPDATAEYDALQREILVCRKCPLAAGRTRAVPGEGNLAAELMFVGEGPGHDEDVQGRPFVGRAGQMLTKIIAAMTFDRADVFITNIVKCRPPGNRVPSPEEAAACWNYLIRQLQIIRPKVIVTLGNPATQNLLNTTVGITRLRGQWQRLPIIAEGLEGTPVMPTFHPAFLLRQYSQDNRQKVWDDLRKVMDLLGLKARNR